MINAENNQIFDSLYLEITFQSVENFVKDIPVGESVVQYILNIIKQSRPETSEVKSVKENILWGPSPRASLALMTTCRAKAFLENRYSPSVFDVQSLVKPILSHRLKLNISAKSENVNIEPVKTQRAILREYSDRRGSMKMVGCCMHADCP